jgi:hypothetical protein
MDRQSPVCPASQVPFIEEIVLGTDGMKEGGTGDFSAWVKDKKFDLGDIPLRIAGKRSKPTA